MNRHMIRLLALTMILSGTFSSCVKEEKAVPDGQQPIEIGLNEPTRSTPIVNVSAINGQDIGIIALYPQASTTRFNSYATVSGSKATLAATQYWPTLTAAQSNHKLNFVSWYPYRASAGGPTTVTGNPSTTEINNEVKMVFTENASMADQKDFMVATHTPAWKGAVVLAFHHALARIRFKFNRKTASDDIYAVNEIRLKKVATTSSLTVTSVTATNEGRAPVLKWLATPTATNEIYWTGSFAVSASGSTYDSMAAKADDSQNTDSFMTIPMTNSQLQTAELVLKYTPNGGTQQTATISLNGAGGITSWEAGKITEYAVSIAGSDATITASSSVVAWEPITVSTDVGDYTLTVSRTNFSFPKGKITTSRSNNELIITTTYSGGWTASFTPSTGTGLSLVEYWGTPTMTGPVDDETNESIRYIRCGIDTATSGTLRVKAGVLSIDVHIETK